VPVPASRCFLALAAHHKAHLCERIFRNDGATTRYIHWLASLGGQSRTTPALPMLLVVVDREVALVPQDPNDTQRGAPVLTLFEQVWQHASPWQEGPLRDSRGLTPQERELLLLLGRRVPPTKSPHGSWGSRCAPCGASRPA
jgi:hypothetical protein